ncbi:HRDC domain-containing protein [Fundicoccus ignavus]|nr:HRDC domain-containing protein [Fundicoccus ignavus]
MRYHKGNAIDYTQKYAQEPLVEDTEIYQDLKRYRYEISQAEGIKAFQVFTNAQLEGVIARMPLTLEELK